MKKHFLSIDDIPDLSQWVSLARSMKKDPQKYADLGRGKVLGLLFFNSSLRTRMSTQRAAYNLGMQVITMNINSDGWALEYADGNVMDQGKAEHIKEAAMVISQYCDVIGVRAFAQLKDREQDLRDQVLMGFAEYGSVPVINLESALGHPLQSMADAITMAEHGLSEDSKVVLSWAPHPRALPHAVANSFVRMMKRQKASFVITHPEGYGLDKRLVGDTPIIYDQAKAIKNADYVYVKNWSSYTDYGRVMSTDPDWMIDKKKLDGAKLMHCLPVRRNVVIADDALDSDQSLVIDQANNRIWSAQCAIYQLLFA